MSVVAGPKIITRGLVFEYDAANSKSYPGSGTVWYDLTGRGNTGTLTNGPTYDSNNGGSIVFDGTDDKVVLPSNANSLMLGVSNGASISEITIDCWINWTSFPTNTIDEIISWWAAGSSTVGFLGTSCIANGGGTNTNPAIRFGDGWVSTGVKFTAATDVSKWWNITAVKASANAYIYRMGVLEATKGSSMSFTVDKIPAIGCHDGTTQKIEFIKAKIANIKIYNRALADSEIKQNFDAVRSRFGV